MGARFWFWRSRVPASHPAMATVAWRVWSCPGGGELWVGKLAAARDWARDHRARVVNCLHFDAEHYDGPHRWLFIDQRLSECNNNDQSVGLA